MFSPWKLAVTFVVLTSALASARTIENYDALAHAKARPLQGSPAKLTRPLAKVATVAHREERLGVPTFVWAAHDGKGAQTPWIAGGVADLTASQAARRYLLELSELYRLSPNDVASARVQEVHDTGTGGIIVRFRQSIDGVEVFRSELNVLMTRTHGLVAISGYLSPLSASSKLISDGFALSPETAIATAFGDLTGQRVDGAQVLATEKQKAGYHYFRFAPQLAASLDETLLKDARVKQVLFSLPDQMEPAFYLELKAGSLQATSGDYVSYVISARDGRVLFRNDLTAHAAQTYKVWADPTNLAPLDSPHGSVASPHPTGNIGGAALSTYAAPVSITLDHAGISTNDPWLAAGATVTNGNNVHAYADIASPDGFSGSDVRADATSADTFDRTYDVTLQPNATVDQRKASVTQLFYNVNYFHDWYYDVGFNEAAGNGQASNLTRGGAGGDPVLAEAQDYSGTDNANMQTPADGESPVMQMYLFTTTSQTTVQLNAPSAIAGQLQTGSSNVGASTFNVNNQQLVLVNDGTSPGQDACQTLPAGSLTGKIALVVRGTCFPAQKAANVQNAGAIAMISYNNQAGSPQDLNNYGTAGVTIPAVSITQTAGNSIISQLSGGATVMATLTRVSSGVNRDGTLDNAIVAHEWGHYISNRLIGNGNGLNNNQGGGMGEGWGDFHSMMMVVRAEDQALTTPPWAGVYPMASYAMGAAYGADAYYYGIRRVPYSTRMDRDPLTFKHIQDGVTLPGTAPISGGTDGSFNSQVHNTGEVWCTMLWEAYAALLSDSARLTFAQAQQRMKGYLVAGYKLTPVSPTMLEARDAILASAYAADQLDYAAIAGAFARRGAGNAATGPDRAANDNRTVVEDFTVGGNLAFVDATLTDDVVSCDADGKLDNAETGTLTIRVKNTGTTTLTQTTGSVGATATQLTFPQGASLTFPTSTPLQVMTLTKQVALAGMNGAQRLPFVVTFTDPGLATVRTITAPFEPRGNFDQINNASTFDDAEAVDTAWTVSFDSRYTNDTPFRRLTDDEGTRWYAENSAQPEGQYLSSPKLNVGNTSNFVVTYKNRWSFESDATNAYDGAVLELRLEGTQQWVDVGGSAQPGYNGTLYAGTQTPRGFWPSANPLRSRPAFVRTSANYPAMVTTTVNLGSTYANKSVYLRFRTGSDDAAGDIGWEVDDISFAGITNLPFPTIVEQGSVCNDRRPTANAGTPKTVDEKTAITLTGSATDPENKPLNYLWTQVSGPLGSIQNGDALTISFTAPNVTKDEVVTLQFLSNDGAQNSIPARVDVLVKNVNHAPTASVVTPLDAPIGSTVTLDASGSSDVDGDKLNYLWRQVSGPDVTLSTNSEAVVTFTAPDVAVGTQLAFALDVADATTAAPDAPVVVVTITEKLAVDVIPEPEAPAAPGCGCSAGSDAASAMLVFALGALLFRSRRKLGAVAPR